MKKLFYFMAACLMLSMVSCKKGSMSDNFETINYSTLNYMVSNDYSDYVPKLKAAGWVEYNQGIDGAHILKRGDEVLTIVASFGAAEATYVLTSTSSLFDNYQTALKDLNSAAPSKMVAEGNIIDVNNNTYNALGKDEIFTKLEALGADKVKESDYELVTKALVSYAASYQHVGEEYTLEMAIVNP